MNDIFNFRDWVKVTIYGSLLGQLVFIVCLKVALGTRLTILVIIVVEVMMVEVMLVLCCW